MTFLDLINEHFSFLETGYQFVRTAESESSVEFRKPVLSILMGWHKGEIDIDFYVHLETPILRPTRSRMFRLYNVAKYKDPKALFGAPKFPNYITSDKDATQELKFASKLMKHYCEDILNGDIKIFEEMVKQGGK